MFELVLAASTMSLQIILAVLGIFVSLRLPGSPARRLWPVAFVLCGGLGVVLTALAAFQNANLRAELRSESAGLRDDLSEARERQMSPRTSELLAERSQTEPGGSAEKIASAAAARIDQLNREVDRQLKGRLAP